MIMLIFTAASPGRERKKQSFQSIDGKAEEKPSNDE